MPAAHIYRALRGRDAEDVIPYECTIFIEDTVGAGVPDCPILDIRHQTLDIRRIVPFGLCVPFRDVEDAIPYKCAIVIVRTATGCRGHHPYIFKQRISEKIDPRDGFRYNKSDYF